MEYKGLRRKQMQENKMKKGPKILGFLKPCVSLPAHNYPSVDQSDISCCSWHPSTTNTTCKASYCAQK